MGYVPFILSVKEICQHVPMGFLIMRVLNQNEGCNLDDIQKEKVESHHN